MATLTMKQIMDIDGITNAERVFLNTVSFLSKKEGYCWASVPKLAELSKTSERTIQRYVKKLVKLGILVEEMVYGEKRTHIKGRKLFIVTPNKEVKPEAPTTKEVDSEQPTPVPTTPNYHIPEEQQLKQDQPQLNSLNHDDFVERFGNPSEKIIALEKLYGIYEFNTVLAGSLNTKIKTTVEAYFAGSLKKNRNRLNQGMHNMKTGANVRRREKTECGHFTRDEKGNLVGNYSYKPQSNNSSNESFDSNRINKMNETASKLGLPVFTIGTVGGIR